MFKMIRVLSRSNSLNQFNRSLTTVTVVGCGLMGSGIAQVSAQSGYKVNLIDLDQKLLDKAMTKIKSNLQRVANKKFKDDKAGQDKFVNTSLSSIQTSTNVLEAAKTSGLIIEAIVENIDVKHKLFKSLDEVAPASCLFASNTSSLSITEIANATKRQDRFGGLHFFNPVPVLALVEVISTNRTSQATTEAFMEYVKSLDKVAIKCKDTPGFVVNRLLVPYLCEGVRMLERGDATAKDIDEAMRLGASHPMGPLTLCDYVGLDTTKFILDGWHKQFPDNPLFEPIPLLNKLVSENKLGQKTGKGFYDYSNQGKK